RTSRTARPRRRTRPIRASTSARRRPPIPASAAEADLSSIGSSGAGRLPPGVSFRLRKPEQSKGPAVRLGTFMRDGTGMARTAIPVVVAGALMGAPVSAQTPAAGPDITNANPAAPVAGANSFTRPGGEEARDKRIHRYP